MRIHAGRGERGWGILTFREHERPLAADGLVFCADGQRPISVSMDGVVKVWDAATGETVSTQVASRSQTVRSRSSNT